MSRVCSVRQFVEEAVWDYLHGDVYTLVGLVDYLINEREYTVERLVKFAERSLRIPSEVVWESLFEMVHVCEETHVYAGMH